MRAVAVLAAFGAAFVPALACRADDGRTGAERLQAEVRTVAARVHGRAAELSALPSLAAALATDAATVRDLSADELMLAPRPDEIVELGQRWNAGRTVSLLRRPADGRGGHFSARTRFMTQTVTPGPGSSPVGRPACCARRPGSACPRPHGSGTGSAPSRAARP